MAFSLISIAEAAVDPNKFGQAIDPIISNIVYPVIALLFGIALIVFVWSMIQVIIKGDDADERSKARMSLLGGLIGMFIMLSAWGIIYIISNTVKAI